MWVFVATEVGKERPTIAEGEKQCRKPQGRERETVGWGEAGLHRSPGDLPDLLPKGVARRQRWYWKSHGVLGSSPAWTCSSSSFFCPVPAPPGSWCRGCWEQQARAPCHPEQGTELPAASARVPMGLPALWGCRFARCTKAERLPSPQHRSPARGTCPSRGNHQLPGVYPTPGEMCRGGIPLLLLLFLPRNPLRCKCWAPHFHLCPCQVWRMVAAGSPPHPGQEPGRDIPWGSSRQYLDTQNCP